MIESFDGSRFQSFEQTSSATPVQDTLHGTLQGTVQEGAMHSEQVQGYTIEQITALCRVARRTAFKYAKDLLEVWYWLPESEFRLNGIYTPFALQEMTKLKEMGLAAYRELTHQQNADAIAASQKPEVIEARESSGLAVYTPPVENTDSIIAGLAVPTRATEKREILKGELALQEQSNDESWEEFTVLMAELQEETEAAQEDDELEFQLLRKQHAAKWLKRKAVLEQDKLRILQGQVAPKNGQSPDGSGVAS